MAPNITQPASEAGAGALVRHALELLESGEPEVRLDFSGVRRIDPGALRAMEELAAKARERETRLVVTGASVDVYRVLKLAGLAGQFTVAT